MLVSKVLQNLANGVEFGKKEAYMEPMNGGLQCKQTRLRVAALINQYLEPLGVFFDGLGGVTEVPETAPSAGETADLAMVHLHASRTIEKFKVSNPEAGAVSAEAWWG